MEFLKHAQEYDYFRPRSANMRKLLDDPRLNRMRGQAPFKEWLKSIGVKGS